MLIPNLTYSFEVLSEKIVNSVQTLLLSAADLAASRLSHSKNKEEGIKLLEYCHVILFRHGLHSNGRF